MLDIKRIYKIVNFKKSILLFIILLVIWVILILIYINCECGQKIPIKYF